MFMAKDNQSDLSRAIASDLVGYDDFLRDLKTRISNAQLLAVLAVNRDLVLLYWQIGRDILNRQQQQGWGAKVINVLQLTCTKLFQR